ncbi:unnamed protein product, partial [Callosobruchus maculatus]
WIVFSFTLYLLSDQCPFIDESNEVVRQQQRTVINSDPQRESNLPRKYNQTRDIDIRQEKSGANMSTTEIIAPIVLMLVMFALNGGVLFYIFRAKKKQEQNIRDEELGALRH